MDISTWVFSFFSVLCSLLCCCCFFLSGKDKKINIDGRRAPPGPLGIPILGHTLWLWRSILDLTPILCRLRVKYGPIIAFKIINLSSVFITDYHVAHEALVQKGASLLDRPLGLGATVYHGSRMHPITLSNGAMWRLLRRNLSSEILSPSRMASFARGRRWALSCLLEDLREQEKANEGVIVPVKSFNHAMFRLASLMCFGAQLDGKAANDLEGVQLGWKLMMWKVSLFDSFPISKLLLWRMWRRFLELRRKEVDIIITLIDARRNHKQQQHERRKKDGPMCYVDSILDLEIPEEGGRKLTEDEMASLCSEFFTASTDTTVAVFEWIMANLVKHQHVQQRLLEEITVVVPSGREIRDEDLQKMPYLKAVILESLRRHPPTHFVLPHVATVDISLHGYAIPKGSIVNIALGVMGRDAEVWEEPLEFRPERFVSGGSEGVVDITGSKEGKMMPFGAGRRMCPGLGLAMLHLEYFVACLVREFQWKTVDGEEVDLSEKMELNMVMKNSLRARVEPRGKASIGF